MKAVYLKCHHGVEKSHFSYCSKCEEEKVQTIQALTFKGNQETEDKRIPIYRGCAGGADGIKNGAPHQCFCTGRCKEIIGYYEDEEIKVSNPIFRIEITKLSDKRYWYKKHVGKQFDVVETPDKSQYVVLEDVQERSNIWRCIDKEDCVTIVPMENIYQGG